MKEKTYLENIEIQVRNIKNNPGPKIISSIILFIREINITICDKWCKYFPDFSVINQGYLSLNTISERNKYLNSVLEIGNNVFDEIGNYDLVKYLINNISIYIEIEKFIFKFDDEDIRETNWGELQDAWGNIRNFLESIERVRGLIDIISFPQDDYKETQHTALGTGIPKKVIQYLKKHTGWRDTDDRLRVHLNNILEQNIEYSNKDERLLVKINNAPQQDHYVFVIELFERWENLKLIPVKSKGKNDRIISCFVWYDKGSIKEYKPDMLDKIRHERPSGHLREDIEKMIQ